MKRFTYFLLIGVLAVGFVTAGTNKAEAMDNESAALVAGTFALIGGAVMYAAALDADHRRPVYVESYPRVRYYREVHRPVRTTVVYAKTIHRDCFPRHHRGWNHDDRRPGQGFGRR